MNIGLVQFSPTDDISENRSIAERRVRDVVDRGAELVILPEIWNVGYFNFSQYVEEAESIDGPTISLLADLADELDVYLHGGSIVEQAGEDYYNTSVLFDRSGDLRETHRKIHLFGYGSRETELITPGEPSPTIVDMPFGTVGLTTCYDLRFPMLFRRMGDIGVDIVLVTSAWPIARLTHWSLLLRTRAVENQTFLAASNLCGTVNETQLGGHSSVVDPWGTIVGAIGFDSGERVVEIDLSDVEAVRDEFPTLADRRLPSE